MEVQKERKTNRWIGRRMVGWMDGWIDGWTGGREGGREEGRGLREGITRRMEEWMGEKIGEVIIGWVNGQMWPNHWVATRVCNLTPRPILQPLLKGFVIRRHGLQGHYLTWTLISVANASSNFFLRPRRVWKIRKANTMAAGLKRDKGLSILPPTDTLPPLRRPSLSLGQAPFVSEKKSLAQDHWRLKWTVDEKIHTCKRLIWTMFIITWKQKSHTLRGGWGTSPDIPAFVHVGLLSGYHSLCTRWASMHLLGSDSNVVSTIKAFLTFGLEMTLPYPPHQQAPNKRLS